MIKKIDDKKIEEEQLKNFANKDLLNVKILGWDWVVSIEDACLIISYIYGWDVKKVMNKRVSSIPYWLKRALKSDKFTATKAIYVKSTIMNEFEVKSLWQKLSDLFK